MHRYGIGVLAVVSAVLLIGAGGQMNTLVPLFAIGVFVGFTLSQVGMVRHWLVDRPAGWKPRALLNGVGALLTGAAAVVVTGSKFTEGAWLIVVVLPLLMAAMAWVNRTYTRIGRSLGLGHLPPAPVRRNRSVVVPVHGVNRLTGEALSAARAFSQDMNDVVAVHVWDPEDPAKGRYLAEAWDRWDPGVRLVLLAPDPRLRLAEPIIEYVRRYTAPPVVVLGEVEPSHPWQRFLQNQRGAVLARALRTRSDALVCRFRFRTHDEPERTVDSHPI